MSLVKPAGITGLATGHALNANITQFFEFGQLNKELVSDTSFTHGGTASNDAGLGDSVLFTSTDNGVSLDASVGADNTVLFIYRHAGLHGNQGESGAFRFLYNEANYNAIIHRYIPASSPVVHGYELVTRGNGNPYARTRILPFDYSNAAAYSAPHILAVTVEPLNATASSAAFFDGATVTPAETPGATNKAFQSPPVACSIASEVGANGATRLAGLVVFNKVLTPTEVASIYSDPWAMVETGPPPASVTISGDLQPGQPFTATATNFASAPVSPATITQGPYTDTVPVTVVDDGGGTYTVTGTMPALVDGGTSPKFGQVTLELVTA